MKINKVILVTAICIALCLILGMGVSAVVLKTWNEKLSEDKQAWHEADSLMQDFQNQFSADIDELMPYDYENFMFYHGPRNCIINASSQLNTLQQFNEVFPVQLVKAIDQDNICVIYKLEKEDCGTTLAYVLFKRHVEYFTKDDGVDVSGNYEMWKKTGELYFVSEEMTQNDFSTVNVGDSILSVIDIDGSVVFDANLHSVEILQHPLYVGKTSYRLLSDGVMVIKFEAPVDPETNLVPELSSFVVAEKTFYPYDGDSSPAGVSLALVSSLLGSNA